MIHIHRPLKEVILLTLVFVIMFQIYMLVSYTKYDSILKKVRLADVPYSIKCFFDGPVCEEGNLDGWSLLHGSIFIAVGFAIPNKYLLVIIFSMLFELVRFHFGYEARPIINPLVNLTGYMIGSFLNSKCHLYRNKYNLLEK
ncbi:MAG: hypothetical protein QXW79_01255 [Thermoplasmata archaeon]